MPSSTSSSSWSTADRALVALGVVLAVYLGALEVAMRVVLPRISNIERRVAADRSAAVSTRPIDPATGAPTVLLLGNSLLLASVDAARLNAALGPQAHATVFAVESTTYLDWYFGWRRLQADGAAPAAVVLCLNARQLVSDATQGEAFAHTFLRLRDLPRLAAISRLDLTTASAYAFANVSAWLGRREGFRNGLMQRWLPNAADLVATFAPPNNPPTDLTAADIEKAVRRLREFDAEERARGGRFAWLVPASTNPDDPAPRIRDAAIAAGITVLMPFAPGELPVAMYEGDAFHLNPDGAARFSDRLAPSLAALR